MIPLSLWVCSAGGEADGEADEKEEDSWRNPGGKKHSFSSLTLQSVVLAF